MMISPEVLLERAPIPEEDEAMPTQWLTVRQASNRLNLHPGTIYRHLQAGTFPCRYLRIGRAWRIDAADVDTLKADLHHLLEHGDTAETASVLTALIEGDG